MSNSRRIFNYDNLQETKVVTNLSDKKQTYKKSISACGVLFYKVINNRVNLLLINYPEREHFDDFGGKIDITDESLFHAMAREVKEESNNLITIDYLKTVIDKDTKTFYNKRSKYYIWLVKVDDTFFPDTSVFGNLEVGVKDLDLAFQSLEINDDEQKEDTTKKRSVQWYDFKKIKSKLACRIYNNKELQKYLYSVC